MKKYDIIRIFLAISLILLVIGSVADEQIMKISALIIMSMVLISVYLSWIKPILFTKETVSMNFIIATSYAILSVALLFGIAFVLDNFIVKIPNINFSIFGSVFVSIIASRAYIAHELGKYL